jgi:hypothetical protein
MTSRSYGGAPTGRRAREEEGQCICGCVNTKESALGAQGCGLSRGEGTASKSCCCQAGGGCGSSGRRRRDVEKQGGVQRGPGSGVTGAGAARGQQVLSTWLARVAGVGQRRKQSRGLEVDEGGLSSNLSKVQGLHCKA